MSTCATCKHAEPNTFVDGDTGQEGQEMFNGQRVYVCSRTRMSYGERVHAQSLAVAQDASDYRAALHVLETFGCVQFESDNWSKQ